jgi:hypothetical protein
MSTHQGRGRPHKSGERYACGILKPEVYVTGNQYQRLRAITRDPLLGSQLGRYGFLGELSPIEVEVGFAIARIQGALDRALGTSRPRQPKSPSYEIGRRTFDSTVETEDEAERARKAVTRFARLESEVHAMAQEFPGIKQTLWALCIDDEPCGPIGLPYVKRALSLLAPVLGIREAARKPDSRSGRDRN